MLELRGIDKSFGPAAALVGADFVLRRGEIHALLGENGAGKSTLMHIAFGMLPPDSGEIRVFGQTVTVGSPRVARRLGIGMVHQHFTSVAALTVWENIQLAVGPVASARTKLRGERTIESVLQQFDLTLPRDARVEDLSVAMKQRLEIMKAMATGATILLLDEPTAVLAPPEVDDLLSLVRRFASGGGSVVLITHKLDEVFAAAGSVTVLRRGSVTFDGPLASQTKPTLAGYMIGSAASTARPPDEAPVGVHVSDSPPGPVLVQGPGFELRGGEIVGVAAVEGNGQRDILRAIAGRMGHTRDDIVVRGTAAFVPEDRTTEGLILDLSLAENLALAFGPRAPWVHGWRLDWAAVRRRTAELLLQFGVRAGGPNALARSLSGGNQQKLVMARAFELKPDILVAENPTRGLDIQAAADVHRRLREAARAGMAVVVHSSDLDEVLELANRVLVVVGGKVSPVSPGETRARVGELMLGVG